MRPLFSAFLAAACLAAGLGLPADTHASTGTKVAIIVGPVGSLTPTYLNLAETAAAAAERHGATVARAYSPNATPANVLAAVADAHVIIYFGHGYGHPSPYGGLDRRRQNGWGLQGPRARGTHDDGLNGYLEYFGEDWIVANARPAPGFVMIYSNTCYAPGASEGGFAPATAAVAAERVASYSRKVFALGGSAYYATDFDRGAADLVERLLGNPRATYGAAFATDSRFVPQALTTQGHWFSPGQQIWLHRTRYTDGPPNYWYAFAGNPDATPIRSWDPVVPTVALERPDVENGDVDPWTVPKLRFSEAVSGVSNDTLRLLDAAGNPVVSEVVHDPGSGAVRIQPAADLDLSARYTISIEPGITDIAGNPLAPQSWSLATRLDADPLSSALPVVLRAGEHRLLRFAPDGTAIEEQRLDLADDRWLTARTRARLPGEAGSWFELDAGALAGWWIAESPRAHAIGLTEEVSLPPTGVDLAAREYSLATITDGAIGDAVEISVREQHVITVDRRIVVDGRSYLRIAGGLLGHEGRWIAVPAAAAPADLDETRIRETRARSTPAAVTLVLGNRTAFRFDGAGRVVERGVIRGGPAGPALVTEATIVVGGSSFLVLVGGPFDGWAVAEASVAAVSALQAREPS